MSPLPGSVALQAHSWWSEHAPNRNNGHDLQQATALLAVGVLSPSGAVGAADVVAAQSRLLWRAPATAADSCIAPSRALEHMLHSERMFMVLRLAGVVLAAWGLTGCVFQATTGDGVVCGLSNERKRRHDSPQQPAGRHARRGV